MKLLLVDNDDCFIHTLANYARQTGAEVVTYRAGFPLELIDADCAGLDSDFAGPGTADDFGVPRAGADAAQAGMPVFGVCLGLQGIVEAFGGELGVLRLSHARKTFDGAASRPRGFRGAARGIRGGPLSFALRDSARRCRRAWK